MKFLSKVLIFNVLLCFLNCKEDIKTQECGKLLESIKNTQGQLFLDSTENKYAVSIHTVGTIDEVKIAYLCEVPKDLNLSESKILFDGFLFQNDKIATIGGLKYYYLEITTIH